MAQDKFVVPEGNKVPEHWYRNSWEEKARENPLYAVMTTPDLLDADPEAFEARHLEPFFAKGQRVFDEHIAPVIALAGVEKSAAHVTDYGCGMGRVLRAVHRAGFACSGIDISPTMLRHARTLVPEVTDLHTLDASGRSGIAGGKATTVFSFAVVKHIARLSEFVQAVREICRVLCPRGTLALNVNSQDFEAGMSKSPERTENYESYSLHFRPGERKPYKRREYTTWSGVYIGIDPLRDMLAEHGVEVLRVYHHDIKKPQGLWVIGKKQAE